MSALLTVIDDAVPAALLARARRKIAGLGDEISYWKTFWFELGEPSNVVEELALALRPRVPLKRLAGVEWWIGRMRTTHVPLDFHHDRDLALFEEEGRIAHPTRSSVLYFNAVKGGSLALTDQRLKRRGDELVLVPRIARSFDSVRPKPNRFVHFDGRLLHGVLDANDQVPGDAPLEGRGEWRLSLVFNWWTTRPRGLRTFVESRRYRALR